MTRFRLALLAALLPAMARSQATTPAITSPSTGAGGPGVAVKLKQPTEIEAKGLVGVIGQNITLHATLRHRGTGVPIVRKALSFTIDGNAAGSAVTGFSGEVTHSYHVPNKPPGPWPVEIRFAGEDEWLASSTVVTLGVLRASTKLTLNDAPKRKNEGETLQIQGNLVRTSDGAAIDGRVVTLTIDGKVAGKPATGDGKFSFNYPIPSGSAPKVQIQAQFEGDVLYAASAAAQIVPVKPPPKKATLAVFDAKGKRGAAITLSAILLPQNPLIALNGAAGGALIVFIGRLDEPNRPWIQLCKARTLPNGKASCAADLDAFLEAQPATTYILRALYSTDDDEWAVALTGDRQLVIAPAPVRLVVTGPASARIGDKILLKVRLTRSTDNGPLPDMRVSLGSTYAKTNAAGEATFNETISNQGSVGPRTLKVKYAGSDFYEKGEGALTLQVLPSVS